MSGESVSAETAAEPSVEPLEETVQDAEALMATIEAAAEDLRIDDYTAPGSDINHGHDLDKHDVRKAFGVRDEFVDAHFKYAPNDHAAVWEMHYRKDEFIAADEQVFTDAPDTDTSKWSAISSRKQKAPIAPETHRDLKRL